LNVQKESNAVLYKIPELDISTTFVSKSQKIRDILSIVQRVAVNSATLLITGESGTGKEVIAEIVHKLSPRKHKKTGNR